MNYSLPLTPVDYTTTEKYGHYIYILLYRVFSKLTNHGERKQNCICCDLPDISIF